MNGFSCEVVGDLERNKWGRNESGMGWVVLVNISVNRMCMW